jgi:hypothetical protein
MEFRLAELENQARQHGIRLGQVATRQNAIDELKRASIVMRAESYRRRLFSEFDRAKEMFLPLAPIRNSSIWRVQIPRARPCSMNWQDWCPLNGRRNTTGSSHTLAPSAQTTRCSGHWKRWASSRCLPEKRPRRSPRSGSHCGRQCFQQSGLPDTAGMLGQSCSAMSSVQEQLVNVLREVAHPDIGVIASIRSTNDSLLRSMTTRAQQMDNFLVRLEKQVWGIWLPVVAAAALALGFALGTWFANARQGTPEASSAAQSQQMPMPETPAQQVVPQRKAKHH